MKKIGLLVMAILLSVVVYAQNDVTKFLGIPVDGSKKEMMKKLKEKEFVSVPHLGDNVLVGEFNERRVYVYIVSNRNKVWRIAASEVYSTDEFDIKLKFNELCRQFKKNKNYVSLDYVDYIIPEEEDISYEMDVNEKRYEACFFQQPLLHIDSSTQSYMIEKALKKPVSITIEKGGSTNNKYTIWYYYDNEYNKANGEDL